MEKENEVLNFVGIGRRGDRKGTLRSLHRAIQIISAGGTAGNLTWGDTDYYQTNEWATH